MRSRVIAAALVAAIHGIGPEHALAAPRGRTDVPDPAPHVLVLNSYHPQYEWTQQLVQGVLDGLGALPPENIHIEFMDARHMVDDHEYLDLLAAAYRYKYRKFAPEIVISSDDSALTFLLARRDELFPGAPIVFSGVNSRTPEELEPIANLTGILEGLEVAGNLSLIERLHPRVRRIVLLGDRTSLGQGMVRVARTVIPRFERGSRKIEIWDDFTIEELGRRVADVDRDTVFLLLAIHEDRAGRYFSFSEDLRPLAEQSRAPIYAMFGMLLGLGVTGGMMNDPREHGQATAAVARRVLEGTPPDAIPVVPSAEYRPRFDYAQLSRFGIAESALPVGSIVVNRPASFHAQHKNLVWTASAVLVALVATIAWLAYLIDRMRRAERVLAAQQEELRREQQLRLIGSLAGGVAHDFNNLITAISGFTQLAADRVPPDHQDLLDDLDQVQRASQRAASLTRQLLSFARRQPVQPRVVDLNQLILDFHKLLRRLLRESIEFAVLPADEPACVRADPGQLEQVVSNLVANARDAMPGGGRLTLSVSVTPNAILLRASDTGSGMSDEVKAHIFEPFYTTKEAGRGTGIGLATVASIVEQAGGSIDVESKLGRGTTFTIRLPRVLEPAAEAEQRRAAAPWNGQGGLVLLVEDDPQVRRVAANALRKHGFDIIEAENGATGLELAKHNMGQLGCVVTDLVMPILGGAAFVRRLRLLSPTVPVLVMSGYVDDASVLDDAGDLDVHFIAKPFLPADLVNAVREVLRSAQGEAHEDAGASA